ncbi:amidohydrolase family protein, partial [Gelidibacter sp.]|uniref:amidohydrolase family protein n=1 Tax=Gelidibacter sp. TaxID=2018083 RepID=UPI002C9B8CF9
MVNIQTSFSSLILIFFIALFVSCDHKKLPADLVITNAVIWTGNDNQPRAEAMAIVGDSIIAIGSATDIKIFIGETTEVKDLKGKFVTPGFIDSHLHLLVGGSNLSSVQLRDAQTIEEFIERIEAYAQTIPEGTWILGGDWDHENWGGELPT